MAAGLLPDRFRVVGISRQDEYTVDTLFDDFRQYLPTGVDESTLAGLKSCVTISHLDLNDHDAYTALRSELETASTDLGSNTRRLYYLSIPAQAFGDVVEHLGTTGHAAAFNSESEKPRLLIEKPFGYDMASAKSLIDIADKYFDESQLYRIDHYLAKETAQNILTFRFNNPLFDSIWNARHIDRIHITAQEKIGIEGRADFYEKTGALRDILQSHLLQLLALVMMEQPAKLGSADIHRSKQRLLDSIIPIEVDEVGTKATRGQYQTYRSEVRNPKSTVETFARLQLTVDNEQWRGVPVIIETGKALSDKFTSVSVHFRENNRALGDNTLTFRLQPEEGITLSLLAKTPGLTNDTQSVEMEFDYARSFAENTSEAYERVILDAVRGDQSLFASNAEVLTSWRIVENVLSVWSSTEDGLVLYPAGTNVEKL